MNTLAGKRERLTSLKILRNTTAKRLATFEAKLGSFGAEEFNTRKYKIDCDRIIDLKQQLANYDVQIQAELDQLEKLREANIELNKSPFLAKMSGDNLNVDQPDIQDPNDQLAEFANLSITDAAIQQTPPTSGAAAAQQIPSISQGDDFQDFIRKTLNTGGPPPSAIPKTLRTPVKPLEKPPLAVDKPINTENTKRINKDDEYALVPPKSKQPRNTFSYNPLNISKDDDLNNFDLIEPQKTHKMDKFVPNVPFIHNKTFSSKTPYAMPPFKPQKASQNILNPTEKSKYDEDLTNLGAYLLQNFQNQLTDHTNQNSQNVENQSQNLQQTGENLENNILIPNLQQNVQNENNNQNRGQNVPPQNPINVQNIGTQPPQNILPQPLQPLQNMGVQNISGQNPNTSQNTSGQLPQPPVQNETARSTFLLRLRKMPKFNGESYLQLKEFIEFVDTLFKDCSNNTEADELYIQICLQIRGEAKDVMKSASSQDWQTIKEALLKYFAYLGNKQLLSSQIQNARQQRDESLIDYANRIRTLLKEKNATYSNLTQIQKKEYNDEARKSFCKGISNGKIREFLKIRRSKDLDDAISFAIETENEDNSFVPNAEMFCRKCRQTGHRQKDCKQTNNNNQSYGNQQPFQNRNFTPNNQNSNNFRNQGFQNRNNSFQNRNSQSYGFQNQNSNYNQQNWNNNSQYRRNTYDQTQNWNRDNNSSQNRSDFSNRDNYNKNRNNFSNDYYANNSSSNSSRNNNSVQNRQSQDNANRRPDDRNRQRNINSTEVPHQRQTSSTDSSTSEN